MKKLCIIFSLLFFSILSQAQCVGNCTAVTATLTDSSGQVWTNATINVNIIAPNGNAGAMQNNGVPLASPVNTTQTNAFGTFTIALDDNSKIFPAGSKWLFIMCPNATIQNCSQLQVTVSGTSMNLSTTLSNVLIVPKVNASPTIQRAYSDTEANGGLGAVYWNTLSNTLRGCTNPFCGTWSPIGGGGGGGLPPGTVGQGVSYNNLNVGVATNSYIDNSQSGGIGVGMQGPVSIFNSAMQMFGSTCPVSGLSLGTNSIGFGSGNDCNPYWANGGGIFQMLTEAYWAGTGGGSGLNMTATIQINPDLTKAFLFVVTPTYTFAGGGTLVLSLNGGTNYQVVKANGSSGGVAVSTNDIILNNPAIFLWEPALSLYQLINPQSITTGLITGPTANGGLLQTGSTLGLLTSCSTNQVLAWNGTAWICTTPSSGSSTNLTIENCAPDQTGNSFYSTLAQSNINLSLFYQPHWEFIFGQPSYINCIVYIPTAQTGATLILDIFSQDPTPGHTANFYTCDGLVTTTFLISVNTCAATQTYTVPSGGAEGRVTLTYAIQSTLSNGSYLYIKIGTSTTGTAPANNMMVYAHFNL